MTSVLQSLTFDCWYLIIKYRHSISQTLTESNNSASTSKPTVTITSGNPFHLEP